MTEVPNPLDTALDLFLYAPVGLMMTAAEELPKLAAKGRTRVNTQVTMARVVGQFAVARGRREFEKRFSPPTPAGSPQPSASSAHSEPEMPATFDEMTASTPSANGKKYAAPTASSIPTPPPDLRVVTGPAPSAAELAIPGYDSLSASQVVQRLAGLSGDELSAVGAYEHAHRGRRTILNRIDQLQGQ